jgi:hypothetical protein
MSVIAALVVYGNLAVTFNPQKLGLHWPGLPRGFALHDAFLIPGMFSGYSSANFDLLLQGQRTDTGRTRDRGQWINLPLTEHFPLRYALSYTQLSAAHHADLLGPAGQRAAWAVYGQKIKARHNRLHADAPIARLRFGIVSFPASPAGYRALKSLRTAWRHLWYADP